MPASGAGRGDRARGRGDSAQRRRAVPCGGGRLIMCAGRAAATWPLPGAGGVRSRCGRQRFGISTSHARFYDAESILPIGGSFGRRVKEMEAREHAALGLPRSEPLPWRPFPPGAITSLILVIEPLMLLSHSWMLWQAKLSANAALHCTDRAGVLMKSACPLPSLQKHRMPFAFLLLCLFKLGGAVCLLAVLAK
jgi:hypothetical protein